MTPGPWTVKDFNADDLQRPNRFEGPVVVYADDDCAIHPIADCSCNHTCRDAEQAVANARLIAAAPDLFAACERFRAIWDGEMSFTQQDMCDAENALRVALKKAKVRTTTGTSVGVRASQPRRGA